MGAMAGTATGRDNSFPGFKRIFGHMAVGEGFNKALFLHQASPYQQSSIPHCEAAAECQRLPRDSETVSIFGFGKIGHTDTSVGYRHLD